MKIARSEYTDAILEFLIKSGQASKYAIAKGTAIPYPTVLRNLPKMVIAHVVHKIGEGKRGAEIYAATPKGTIIAYFRGRVRTSELLLIDKALLFDGRSIKKIVLYVKGKFATKCRKMLDAVPKITERMRRVDTGLEKFE